MPSPCGFCHWSSSSPHPYERWIEVIQGHLDHQPHPDRLVGLIPCDRRVFEDESWFCVVSREPLAEAHVMLISRHHVRDLSALRGYSEDNLEPGVIEAARSTLLDDLIIAHDVVLGYDKRVESAVVLSGLKTDHHLYFDIVPVYRFDHGNLHTLGETQAVYEDMSLPDKRKRWETRVPDFSETSRRLRDEANRVIRSRPGRRRAGLVVEKE
ncbi:MAG: hypothetical protein GQ558_01410 [Thermoplasmata archaeon]|nr:hypothetical protein [Thermoplasmata archaeon]